MQLLLFELWRSTWVNRPLRPGTRAHLSRARGCANYGPKSMGGCESRLYKVGLIVISTAGPFLNIIHCRAFSGDQQVLAGTVFTAPCSCITHGDTALQSQPDEPLRVPAKAASPTPPLPCSAQLTHHDRMKRAFRRFRQAENRSQNLPVFYTLFIELFRSHILKYRPPLNFLKNKLFVTHE